jgi:hypothetical protein
MSKASGALTVARHKTSTRDSMQFGVAVADQEGSLECRSRQWAEVRGLDLRHPLAPTVGDLCILSCRKVRRGNDVSRDPLVRKLSFTGSTEVGKLIMHAVADRASRPSRWSLVARAPRSSFPMPMTIARWTA